MLAPTRAPEERLLSPLPTGGKPPSAPRGPCHRARRIALTAALLCLVPVIVSYAHMLGQASNSSLGVRTVEWLRDNGARSLVSEVESIYYSLNAPSTGGPALRSLPQQSGSVLAGRAVRPHAGHAYRPLRIRPIIHPALPGEGVWRATLARGGATSASVGATPPVLITSFRPDPAYPRLVAGVAWINQARTSTWLYPGRLEPNVTMSSRGPEEVPPRLRPQLLATFNSGFKLQDSGGGFAVGGHAYAPLRRGLATFVRHGDGRVDIVSWEGGPDVGPDIISARQNLPLIVEHGAPNPNLSDGPEWGATLGNSIRVWRSAVGVDRHHNLIYVAANDQTVGSLAAIMIRAGATRAMELDINSYWVSFITYHGPGASHPENLLPGMNRPASRYLTPDDRDFFAVYSR